MSPAYLVKLMLLIAAILIAATLPSECHSPFKRSLLSEAPEQNKEKLTHLHFYFHDRLVGPNITTVQVTEPSTIGVSGSFFGVISITDTILTEGPDISSRLVGKGQGMYSFSSKETVALTMVVNYVFVEGEYNGSYISVLGRNAIKTEIIRELSIVGGAGAFRLARGYVQFKTHTFDPNTSNAIVECDFYVYHH